MDQSPNLTLPYIIAAQAQKHVTHNEAIRILDAIVQLTVADRSLTAPPITPADGDRYIVAAGATGIWSGHDGSIAAWQDGAWAIYAPSEGWLAWVTNENALVVWDGTTWLSASAVSSINPADLVGINTTADTTNRLAVKSDAMLFSHDDVRPGSGDMRAKLNKAATANVASLLFQNGFSGRSEIGLIGNDAFAFKVSPDGTIFYTPLVLNTDGSVTFEGSNPNNAPAVYFDKQRSTSSSYRYSMNDVGGLTSDGSGGAYWRGFHMSGVLGGIVYSAVQTYPSMAQYFEYDSQTDPTFSRFIFDVANANGNTHDLIFRVNSATDLLRLNGTAAYFAKSILPTVDNAIALGSSSARFSEVWAANGTIQTSDAREKLVEAAVAPDQAGHLIDAVEPVLYRWASGGNTVIEDFDHTIVPPDAGEGYDFDAAKPKGTTETVSKPGKRLHAGFLAQDVKKAMDEIDIDFGAWGLEDKDDADSRQWVRPDQLIAVLWSAVRALRQEVKLLGQGHRKKQR